MIVHDISLSLITIEEPRASNDLYIFDIRYDGKIMDVSVAYEVFVNKKDNDNLYLSINNKSDLVHLHKIYTQIIEYIFQHQNDWFENQFSIEELTHMFSEFLKPNYNDNCIDCVCTSFNEFELSIGEGGILPILRFESVVFDGKTFKVSIELLEFEQVRNNDESKEMIENANKHTQQLEETVSEVIENEDNVDNNNEELSESDMNQILDSSPVEENVDDIVEEVELDDSRLGEINMKINDEDYYILYKLIQGRIYNNMSNDLRKIMEEKNIKNIDDIDINELLYDITDFSDDDENSESGLNDDDEEFENNYSNMV
jgi:hypothetical protein